MIFQSSWRRAGQPEDALRLRLRPGRPGRRHQRPQPGQPRGLRQRHRRRAPSHRAQEDRRRRPAEVSPEDHPIEVARISSLEIHATYDIDISSKKDL